MESQTTEDKLSVLNTIFGNDLTQSVITNTLRENNNQFDPAVEKLLTLPANKTNPPPPPQPAPIDGKGMENIQRLHTMFGDLTQSVITTVYESNKRDVEGTVDTLLNMTSNEVASGARRDAEVARQEQELRAYEEFVRQEQLRQEQEQARKAEQRRKTETEEAQKKAEQEKKMRDERDKALQEQERMLLEFQRKKAEEQERLQKEAAAVATASAAAAAEALKKRVKAEEDAKAKAEDARKRIEEEKKKAEDAATLEKRKAAEETLKRLQLEQEALAKEKKRMEEEEKLAEERRQNEERLILKRLEEEKQVLLKQKQLAEEERKRLDARMKAEMQREEEERKKLVEHEKRFLEEQELMKKSWEEKVRKLENERRAEEQKRIEEENKRMEAKRAEEELRARQEADMRKILELERLKLDEQRKRVEEEKKLAEERLHAMELAAKKREEEEQERQRQEEERRREEEERNRLLEEEEKEKERMRQELSKIAAQEKFAASAIMVPPAVDEPKVQIIAQAEGNDIRGTWTLLQGVLPSAQSWLGLFARRSINTYLGFSYVSGTSGEFHFKNLAPGHYEVRIFGNKLVTSRIAESAPMLIGPQVLSFGAQIQGDHIMLEYKLDPPSTPTSRDWVGIYEKTQRRNKVYLSSAYSNTAGTISAVLPRTPGQYEARLFVTGSKYNEQAAVDFTVVDNDHVTAELGDGVIKASWELRTVEPTSSDWIGLFSVNDSANNKYLASAYTQGASAGSGAEIPVPKDLPAGVYELRLFSSKVGKYTTFKVSNAITL